MMTRDFSLILRPAGSLRGRSERYLSSRVQASRDQVGGALSSATVPRVGLGPTTPPLCRCAERATAPILRAPFVIHPRPSHPRPSHPRLSRHPREGGDPVFPTHWIPAFAGMTNLRREALGVSGVAWTWGFAKSRRSPKGGGHSRSHLPQVRRGVQKPGVRLSASSVMNSGALAR